MDSLILIGNADLRRLPRRSGSILIEVMVAAAVMAIMITTTVEALALVAARHLAADQRQWAIEEAENIVERLHRRPWDLLTADAKLDPEFEVRIAQSLPGGRGQVIVTHADGPPPAKRLDVEIAWQGSAGAPAKVRLTAWVFQTTEAIP